MDIDIHSFADLVGGADTGAVWIRGRGTRVTPPSAVRIVDAPTGITEFQPDEMTVVCGAGTTIQELVDEIGQRGQYINLPDSLSGQGTVGGALARGVGDIYRLGRGNLRDTLLQAKFIDHRGQVITAGGPTVKNVSGFDLCRLLVGSQGLLGFMGEVILRTRPIAPMTQWFSLSDVPYSVTEILLQNIYRPASVMTNGASIWFCLEGHPGDIADTLDHLSTLAIGPVTPTSAPDLTNFEYRSSMSPRLLAQFMQQNASDGKPIEHMVEAGVGIIHSSRRRPVEPMEHAVEVIHQRLLQRFNPDGRLNPGVSYLV